MRYAITFRGISFMENYNYHNHYPGKTHTIDFMDNLPYLFKNIIRPLEQNNHTVDIFFLTYDNEKLKDYINILEPKKVKVIEYSDSVQLYNWNFVRHLMIESLKLVEDYASSNNIVYDYTIVARFDCLFIENILNVYLEPDGFSQPVPNDDFCFITGKAKNKMMIDFLQEMQSTKLMSHEIGPYATQKGIKCHCMYVAEHDNNNYPFVRLIRSHIERHKDHPLYQCSIIDLWNPNSKYYGFRYKPFKEFNPCHYRKFY